MKGSPHGKEQSVMPKPGLGADPRQRECWLWALPEAGGRRLTAAARPSLDLQGEEQDLLEGWDRAKLS